MDMGSYLKGLHLMIDLRRPNWGLSRLDAQGERERVVGHSSGEKDYHPKRSKVIPDVNVVL